MKAVTYFKKRLKIYGVSYKYEFGYWDCYCIEFHRITDAQMWLDTNEYAFRTRELLSKYQVIKQFGKKVYNTRIIRGLE